MARFNTEEEDRWISLSDIMTGLMVIFMFIAIAYMIDTQEKQKALEVTSNQIRIVQDSIENILGQYRNSRSIIYENMQKVLGRDLDGWGATIDSTTLTIRFSGKSANFSPGEDYVPSSLAKILDEFVPKYLGIVSDRSYAADIVEVKVEGHAFQSGESFMKILAGSQNRARNVLNLIRSHASFLGLPTETQEELNFKLTTTGMGYGRMLDQDMNFTAISKQSPCAECSRRVEFTILTASERIINKVEKFSKK